MKKKTIIWIAVAVVALLIIGSWLFGGQSDTLKMNVVTAPATRGNVSESISATGTIEPVTQVEVGTQVSGIIDRIYVDYNSVVKKGELIAEMDKVTLMSDLNSSQANYNGSKASFEYQEKLYNRNKLLHDKQLISDQEYDQSLYNYENAKAQFAQSTANLAKAQRNLSYATIYSPIDGVVINKAVEEGQTVAAGFNTPTLFNIAADLTQMRVIADVDEADIGGIVEGLRATFTVDAYPDETFEGTVVQVRLGEKSSSTTSSSVVTYEVVINAPNNDLKLKPRLTATVTIYKQEKSNVIVVPSRALRFKPTPEMGATQINDVDAPQKVWTKEGTVYTAHAVKAGLTGNNVTEVEGISEGTEVVVDATSTFRENGMMNRMGPGGGPGPGGPM
ncbi:MAG: efflux RND transporter periplasmic adaptor subunit [Bacteroidaceae bacterium]|jgi:HlyD family secretion protein|nr:efflux RND transporter periplasmic adaptor subunit [Bacteroidaceae bacterium]